MVTNRKTRRSRRVLAASALLLTAVVVATVGIVVATVPGLIAATAYSLLAGIVAARLIANDLAQMRRDWARDRATLADDHRQITVVRALEQTTFVNQLGARLRLRESQIHELRESLVAAEIDVAHSAERLAAEQARNAALDVDVNATRAELDVARGDLRLAQDALAESQTAELHARAEILAWQEAASSEASRAERRPA